MKPAGPFFRILTLQSLKTGQLTYLQKRVLFIMFFLFPINGKLKAQNEVPPYTANMQTLKAGCLIIPMDTDLQAKPGYFNMKAYGLVNALLRNEIPVMWAIKKGKTRATAATSTDFTANVIKIFPDTGTAASTAFRCGPFVIDSSWVSKALTVISAFGSNVVVYNLNTSLSVDIRYTLTFKPYLCLLNGGGYDTISSHILTEAGFTTASYKIQSTGQIFTPSQGYSMVSDAHYTPGDTAHINPVKRFLNIYGGNLVVTCTSIGSFENKGLFATTGGIDSFPTVTGLAYANHDSPLMQFLGPLQSTYGEFRYWNLHNPATNSFTANTYHLIRGTSGTNPNYMISATKLWANGTKGGNIMYVPSHDYFSYVSGGSNTSLRMNGRRVYMNMVFVPPNDSTNLDFITDVKLTMTTQTGLAVKNEPFNICFIVKNIGHWRAKNINVQAPLPPGLIYQSHVCAAGSYNSITGTWILDSLTKNQTDTLCLTVMINQLGSIVLNGVAVNQSLEYSNADNSASITITGVSRPNAVIDSVNFISPVYQDIISKANDTDEDGGPFGNTQILAGPYNGTAQVINGDTIRYWLNAGYTGMDSILYQTCDQYPLCDSAWIYINIQSPLPVEFLQFVGKRSDGKIQLHWTTLSETNNDYFSVERCIDNVSFEVRGNVDGNNNSNILRNYYFSDSDNEAPVYYYRLRQLDFNGDAHVSPVIALPLKKKDEPYFRLIPNPIEHHEQLRLLYDNLTGGHSQIIIEDITGRIIFRDSLFLIDYDQLKLMDINSLIEPGCYLVTLITPFKKFTERLIVR